MKESERMTQSWFKHRAAQASMGHSYMSGWNGALDVVIQSYGNYWVDRWDPRWYGERKVALYYHSFLLGGTMEASEKMVQSWFEHRNAQNSTDPEICFYSGFVAGLTYAAERIKAPLIESRDSVPPETPSDS